MSVGMGAAGGLLAKGAGHFFGAVAEDAEGEVASAVDEVGAACSLSFSSDTPVATPTSERPIASVQVGDTVTAVDPTTGTRSAQTVEATSLHTDSNLVDVTLRVESAASAAATTASTASQASQPRLRQRVARTATRLALAAALATTVVATVVATVVVGGASAAPASAAATAASHSEVIHTTTNHPWLTADHGWLPAGFLRIGEPVVTADGASATVAAVRVVPGAAPMWDLTVANVHTFAVGDAQVVVHNNNCGPVNSKGETYPTVLDPRTNKPIPFPDGELKVVPKESRVLWDSPTNGFWRKAAYITEWFDRKLPKLAGSWSDYELHHVRPREYGGTNDFENLVPLSRAQHRLFTNWWAGYLK